MIALVLGGARSGKSTAAEELTAHLAGEHRPVSYLATAVLDGDDVDFAARVALHQARRPTAWTTVACGPPPLVPLPQAIADAPPDAVLLVDSLGTWVAGAHPEPPDVAGLLAAVGQRPDLDVVVVSDEVGLSVHPETETGRRFRDVLGTVNQQVAARAEHAWLVVAGRTIALAPASWPARPC